MVDAWQMQHRTGSMTQKKLNAITPDCLELAGQEGAELRVVYLCLRRTSSCQALCDPAENARQSPADLLHTRPYAKQDAVALLAPLRQPPSLPNWPAWPSGQR